MSPTKHKQKDNSDDLPLLYLAEADPTSISEPQLPQRVSQLVPVCYSAPAFHLRAGSIIRDDSQNPAPLGQRDTTLECHFSTNSDCGIVAI